MTNGSNDNAVIDTRYEFFPSVREGYRPNRSYEGGDLEGRTTMGVTVKAQGVSSHGEDWTAAERDPAVDLRMYGPGDVTGIDSGQVVRVEPEPQTSTLSPNYFAHIEFDRADLPWLFSPERADVENAGKTRPWMALVVVERANDDVSVEADGTKPLPALTTPAAQLPPIEEVWAWAHVQVTGELSGQELEQAVVNPNEQVVSRLICPRNLDANKRYLAAVVPTFEPGVRAGLGKEPFDQGADVDPADFDVKTAWDREADELVTLPVYHKWEFTTGDKGDFESLARKLDPERLDKYDVGVREVDVADPGPPSLATEDLSRKVGGALQSAGLETAPYPKRKSDRDLDQRKDLRDLLNDPADADSVEESDVPVMGPPIYGQWYLPEDAGWELGETGVPEPPGLPESSSGTDLSKYFHSWLHDLNLDPQYRLPASYGTEVIQENQEQLMEAAWKMFGDLVEANRRIGFSQAGDLIGGGVTDKLEKIDTTRFSQRVVDPRELNRKIEAYQILRERGLFSPDEGIDEIMSGEITAAEFTESVEIQEELELESGGLDRESGVTDGFDSDQIAPDGMERDQFESQLSDRWAETVTVGDEMDTGDADVQTGGEDTFGGDSIGRTGAAVDERLNSQIGGVAGSVQETFATQSEGQEDLLQGDLATDGAGLVQTADVAMQTARMAEVHSSSFRRLTRHGGKLARGVEASSGAPEIATERASETFSFDAADALGSRFGAGRAAQPPTESESAGTDLGSGAGGLPPAFDLTSQTDWRVDDAGNVLSLEEAVDRYDGPLVTVPKALLAIRSVREHCDSARDRLSDLDAKLTALQRQEEGALQAVVASLTERPTVGDQCRAISQNTFDALARQLGKLVAADPEPLAEDFTDERRQQVLERLRTEHDRLLAAVEEATDAVQADEFAPTAVREQVGIARDALIELIGVLDTVETHLDSGIPPGTRKMQPMMGELEEATYAQSTPLKGEVESGEGATTEMMAMKIQLNDQMLHGIGDMPGVLDASGWSKQAAAMRINPGLAERDVELAPILAAPKFEQPMYEWLKRVDETYLLPGAEKVPQNSIGAVETSSKFIESLMCGLNHEMARELLWRKFPTDRRGTYFQQFWDYIGTDDQPDIQKMHRWRDSALGENRPADIPTNRVVLMIRGELLDAYPNTRIYAVKAVREDRSEDTAEGEDDEGWDRMPLLEQKRRQAIEDRENNVSEDEQTLRLYDQSQLEKWKPKKPIFRGKLEPGITFLGFDLPSAEAEGETMAETDDLTELGWFFVLEEPVGETRFGLDVASAGDYGSVPYGVRYGAEGDGQGSERAIEKTDGGDEYGWNGLSWGHLVDDEESLDGKEFVTVGEDNPAGGNDPPWAVEEGDEWSTEHNETFDYQGAAEWAFNSAHMANITWQLPVRICIHADDILPDMTDDEGGADRAAQSLRFEMDPTVQLQNGGGD